MPKNNLAEQRRISPPPLPSDSEELPVKSKLHIVPDEESVGEDGYEIVDEYEILDPGTALSLEEIQRNEQKSEKHDQEIVQRRLKKMRSEPDAPRRDTKWEREVEIQDDDNIIDYLRNFYEERAENADKGMVVAIEREANKHVNTLEPLLNFAGVKKWGDLKERLGVHGRYGLLKKGIGEGAMGSITLAIDKKTMNPVAIKTIIAESEAKAVKMRARFKQEIESHEAASGGSYVLKPLDVVDVKFDVNKSGEAEYGLVMPYVKGVDLAKYLKRGELDKKSFPEREKFVGEVALQLCAALHGMKNVLHRDIKPENIMLEDMPGGEVRIKLFDFGFGKILKKEEDQSAPPLQSEEKSQEWMGLRIENPDVTQSGIVVGTPLYMPPEIITGEPNTIKSDLYSSGVTLYRLLTGNFPIGRAEMDALLRGRAGLELWRHIKPPLTYLPNNEQGVLDDIIMSLLSADSKKRAESPEKLAVLIGEALLEKYPEMRNKVKIYLAEAGIPDNEIKDVVERKAKEEDLAAKTKAKGLLGRIQGMFQ